MLKLSFVFSDSNSSDSSSSFEFSSLIFSELFKFLFGFSGQNIDEYLLPFFLKLYPLYNPLPKVVFLCLSGLVLNKLIFLRFINISEVTTKCQAIYFLI